MFRTVVWKLVLVGVSLEIIALLPPILAQLMNRSVTTNKNARCEMLVEGIAFLEN